VIGQNCVAEAREGKGRVFVRNHLARRWGVGLAAALMACGAFGAAPVQTQSVPDVVPSISAIVVGISPTIPSLGVSFPGDNEVRSQGGLTWSATGRADVDVDVDIDQQHEQVAAARFRDSSTVSR
jgi:hypothetical protein